MYLPLELIRLIVQFILAQPRTSSQDGGNNDKPEWASIHSFSLVSKTYRDVALEAWFSKLYTKVYEDTFPDGHLLPEIFSKWTSELHCVQLPPTLANPIQDWYIDGFTRLRKIRLDWLSIKYTPYCPLSGSQDNDQWNVELRFSRAKASGITELDLRDVLWPSPVLLRGISRSFPALRVLRLRQLQTWCGLCNTCCIARFKEPCPTKIVYENGLGLPGHNPKALSCLEQLEYVYLNIGVLSSGTTILADGNKNENTWTGECDSCMASMYSDEEFRRRWVEKKKSIPREERPPSLKKVEWSFWTASPEDDDSEYLEEESDSSEEGSELDD
ncbi:uncharacterized protein BT62DRAFT_975891 [Guyanagaster necrorhizus]|uniref:F-box domain-containing protein n=1 Tax=Guyanagaster necrorhizus TaxID=856835 RepID=A0A9P7VH71_9AGAR|nr:uncharacterized protein BT62DRAFT_975891 [Guyanagaster necrorhizus MCA 3950]KAG7440485.1 hypothetical protein BT62DRAFT_975891 [Guyanagaster necrorhizus MCA 3950]